MERNCKDCQRKIRWCKDEPRPVRCYDCQTKYRNAIGGKKNAKQNQ